MADFASILSGQDLNEGGIRLSPAYDHALRFARVLHERSCHQCSGAPHLSHLLGVSGLVLQHGGDEMQAIAALLHDAVDEQAGAFGGAGWVRQAIRHEFGADVLRLVELCSDCDAESRPPWLVRKCRQTLRLLEAPAYDCLVTACDQLHSLRCLNSEIRDGDDPWRRLNAGLAEQHWHFSVLTAVFESKDLPVAADLRFELGQLQLYADAAAARADSLPGAGQLRLLLDTPQEGKGNPEEVERNCSGFV
jgi:(p)ppGpp synthase/HD superfamily hydrolase